MKVLSGLGLALLAGALAGAQESTYDPKGRRDPFVSFATPLAGDRQPSCAGPGLGSRLVEEVTLTGIVSTGQGRRAMLVTPDGQTHFASERSKLCNGHVLRIDAGEVVFVKRVDDPLSAERQIEIRRLLHPER
jgi:hypothetical protein